MSSPAERRNREREAERDIDRLRLADEAMILARLLSGAQIVPGERGSLTVNPLSWDKGGMIGITGLAALGRLSERGIVSEVRDGPWIKSFVVVDRVAAAKVVTQDRAT